MRTRALTRLSLLMLALACLSTSATGQDAGSIINQYIKAIGGSKVVSRVQTLAFEGSVTRSSDGKSGTFTLDSKLPNRYYQEFLLGEHAEILAYNGKSAWHQSLSGEILTLLGAESLQLESAAQFYNGGLLNLKKNKIGAALVDHVQVNGRDALHIELTNPTGVKRELFFDPETHFLVRQSAPMPGGDLQIDSSEYQPESGLKVAHRLNISFKNDTYQVTATRIVVNGVIGERVFDFPVKSQVKLPDLKQLFQQIDDNQKTLDKVKENYAGTRDEEETEYDNTGKVTKVDKKRYDFFYLNGDEISTLVSKDGKPLSEAEQQKENEKTRKEIADNQKAQAKKQEKEEKQKEKEKEKEKEEDDDPGIEIFLRTSQFVNPRRERFRGQDVLVFDFEPNPEYKPKKLAERVVQKLAGVVWVDEKALQVVRLEAYFISDVKFAGGLLANLQKGTSFTFEQAYVNNEVWLPTYEEAHVGVRLLLVKGFKINEVTRYSDYKRFKVETLDKVGKAMDVSPPPAPQQ